MHRKSSTSLVSLHPPISSTSIGGIRQYVVQIPSIYEILMGYWVAGQVRTMSRSVIYKSKFRRGDMILRRVLMIPCETILRSYLNNTRRVSLI